MDRVEFSKLLDEVVIPGNIDEKLIHDKVKPIRDAIIEMMPDKLYRYRTINDYNIEALLRQIWSTLLLQVSLMILMTLC